MLSDESSSDSETGRFKCQAKKENEAEKSNDLRDKYRSSRHRKTDDRNHRQYDRRRDDRGERQNERRRSKDRYRYSRYSPRSRRRNSRDRSPRKRSIDRERHGKDVGGLTKHRSLSRDRQRHSRSLSHKKSPERKKDLNTELKRKIVPKEKSVEKEVINKKSPSPDYRAKKSEVHIPSPKPVEKRKSDSPIIVDEYVKSDASEDVQAGSYYKMIPAVLKENTEESSEIDSSDDERLRAKLLNLEKELHKTRKKKHRKKHKRKSSKSRKDLKDTDTSSAVEVTSTTDIPEEGIIKESLSETTEVTSTQRITIKDSSEEGEISSDDSKTDTIDPTDLRHKLKKGKNSHQEVCGPALPPHLQSKFSQNTVVEGPLLPPSKAKSIGPSIPQEMREVLASREVTQYESSDEDLGIGPLPVGSESKWSDAHKRLEERALEIKINKMDGGTGSSGDTKSREQWMLELPEAKAKILGLEARTFRAKEGPDMSDRSSWTDTPEEKARKAAGIQKPEDPEEVLKRDARALHIAKRDEEQESAAKKHKKKHKRDESLLDLHQKKLKKKKKKEEKEDGKKERRPFSRDVDLQVNRFDEAQKKSIIKKAQQLDTRFSRGEAKYL